jgi:hypothetical protein
MTSVPLGSSDWERSVTGEPFVPVLNRYFEQNPTNLEEQVALIARPGLRRYLQVGSGPIRQMYSQPGSFSDSLFAVSYDGLYKITADETVTQLGSGIFGWTLKSTPSMCATAAIGTTPEYLYIADGRNLWIYSDSSAAIGLLTTAGTIVNLDKIEIGGVYYQWTSGSVNAGTPAGTLASPWLVTLGLTNTINLGNMLSAINLSGTSGTTYSTATVKHPSVNGASSSTNQLKIVSSLAGALGNGTTTTVTTGTSVAWGAGTLTGGGTAALRVVDTPDNVGIVSVAYISGFVVCVVAQGYGVNGRFYWINPGDTFIENLNFATAERSPDGLISARAVGDELWLLGYNSTEVWYVSGGADTPFLRVQGRLFDRGVFPGTDVQIKDNVMVMDSDGFVYRIVDGSPQRVSTNAIEEQLRAAIIEAKKELF